MTTVIDNSKVSKHLGQTSEYKDQYDPHLLVHEPRSSNRRHLEIYDDRLPFVGYDVWNAYEVSGLTYNGLPATGVAKIVYPCNSKYIVESKSIKLYFNSFNMYKCGCTPKEVLQHITDTAREDLSNLLETEVQVYITDGHEPSSDDTITLFPRWRYHTIEASFTNSYLRGMSIDQYTETPELLEIDDITFHELDGPPELIYNTTHLHSGLLKSNCRVTSQPDWGDVYIYIKSHNGVNIESILKYIISFRDECHFHEEICETIYKRLMDVYVPDELCVTCLYARRGGIDINPVRASSEHLINKDLITPEVLHTKTLKQ
ncbi:NADPH-dependent 7-cyano-7-deazaguanine reductase QueF [archaeon]|nr:NADPH-dependent 7-cyano-7-deazaguanine reductase QueF [archaeon]